MRRPLGNTSTWLRATVLKTEALTRSLDLMDAIDGHENVDVRDRAYYLTLYHQCHKATRGYLLKDILATEPTK
jgi:hypothetical protein